LSTTIGRLVKLYVIIQHLIAPKASLYRYVGVSSWSTFRQIVAFTDIAYFKEAQEESVDEEKSTGDVHP